MKQWYVSLMYKSVVASGLAVVWPGIQAVVDQATPRTVPRGVSELPIDETGAAAQVVRIVAGPVDSASAASGCTDCIDPMPAPTPRPTAKPMTPKPAVTAKPVVTVTPKAAVTSTPTSKTTPTPTPIPTPQPVAFQTATPSPARNSNQLPAVLGANTTQSTKVWWQNALMAPAVVATVGIVLIVTGLYRVWRQARS